MKCQCVVRHSFSYTWAVFLIELIASGLSLSSESQSNAADKRLLDILRQGLATEFPNPERIGCPGNSLLKGIAQGKVSLTEAEPWLDHLGSCSPCFQEFKEFRQQSAIQRRRALILGGHCCCSALRGGGMACGCEPDARSKRLTQPSWIFVSARWLAGRARLTLVKYLWKFLEPLNTWFLIFRLEAKKEPTMSVCSLKRVTRFCAQRGWRNCMITLLICGLMLTSASVRTGAYSLGVRQASLEWTRYPIRVF